MKLFAVSCVLFVALGLWLIDQLAEALVSHIAAVVR